MSAAGNLHAVRVDLGHVAAPGPDSECRRTDQGNAERLVEQHGAEIRYVNGLGWHSWDGRRFRRDDDGDVMRRAKLVARQLFAEVADCTDDHDRKAAAQHANRSNGEPRLRAMVELARTELAVIARPDQLDADPYLLNVHNGVIDLRTGALGPHDPRLLQSKFAPTIYAPDVTHPTLERFLADVTGGDDTLLAFLQRAAGYSLTGATDEESLFFAHGPAATGKSTLLEALKATMGDYATTADFEAFLSSRNDGGGRADIARLAGARLVLGLEVDDGRKLAQGLIKQLTGRDTITARHLYGSFFEFRPAFKLWLAANARPQVNASDEAMWRRIIQMPFTTVVAPAKRDPGVKRAMIEDGACRSALLAWAVKGCIAWQRDGLQVPHSVRDYTAEYRAENDPLAEWMAAHWQLGPQHRAVAAELRASYEEWAAANGDTPLGSRRFAEGLRAHGCNVAKGAQGTRMWAGIGTNETGGAK